MAKEKRTTKAHVAPKQKKRKSIPVPTRKVGFISAGVGGVGKSDRAGVRPAKQTIAERKVAALDWLEKQDGSGLISDDFGRWAVSASGFQNIPNNPRIASDISTTFFIEASEWRPSILEAIEAAIERDSPTTSISEQGKQE